MASVERREREGRNGEVIRTYRVRWWGPNGKSQHEIQAEGRRRSVRRAISADIVRGSNIDRATPIIGDSTLSAHLSLLRRAEFVVRPRRAQRFTRVTPCGDWGMKSTIDRAWEAVVQQALAADNALVRSLQSRAFRGEL